MKTNDYQQFIDELTEAVESGYTINDEEIVGYDTTRTVLNIMEMLHRWQCTPSDKYKPYTYEIQRDNG